MKTKTTLIISIVISLMIGGSVGYFSKKGANNNNDQAKELQASIIMMKEQSLSIQKMGEIMTSSGIMMQEMGTKYKDNEATVRGRDLQMLGEKYFKDNASASTSGHDMK